jgi:uncharacterized membrane protein YcaP (DUF421 family)
MIMSGLHVLIGQHGDILSPVQVSLRAVVVFAVGFAYVRVAGKRIFGKWGALDIILAVIIGSNLSRAITGGAPFVATIFATGVLVLLHAALVYGAVWFRPLGGWLKGRATHLVRDGVIDIHAMRRHAIGDGDLQQALRAAGQIDLSDVQDVFLERNGDLSVILRRDIKSASGRPRGKPA